MKSETIVGWISAAAALVSVVISIIALVRANTAVEHENIAAHAKLEELLALPATIHQVGHENWPATFDIWWKVIISNHGSNTISVETYDVWECVNNDVAIGYSGLRPTSLYRQDGATSVDLPLSIDPGQAEAVFLRVGVITGKRAAQILTSDTRYTGRTWKAAEELLRSSGIDLYDNVVTALDPANSGGAEFSTQVTNAQNILASFTTTRGTRLMTDVSLYGDWPQRKLSILNQTFGADAKVYSHSNVPWKQPDKRCGRPTSR